MNPAIKDVTASVTAPDIAGRFQAGLRDTRAKTACSQNGCRWQGNNLSKHLREEHNVVEELLAEAASEDKTPTSTKEPSTNPDDTQPMPFGDAPAAAGSPSSSRPSRRRLRVGAGRKVETSIDPDYNRGSAPSSSSGVPPKLYDHKVDSSRPVSQRRNTSPPASRQGYQRSPPQAPRPRNNQAHALHHGAPTLLRKPPAVTAPALAPPATPSTLTSVNQLSSSEDVYDQQPKLILQPETRPISQEQLVAEVKGIYAGLVMVEAKCIEVDSKQAAAATQNTKGIPRLNDDQWQALIALHRTLLHEHHDFFLASQHPSAAPSLRKLATKYAMPARMWRHGIHSFLEVLRHRLPDSFEHMLEFIYLAYAMMSLLYETVPAFADTWVECLGDLGRYRMAIEEGDPRDREVWMNVSRFWYTKGTDRQPHIGRLYHHLAILARPNILQQLFFYSKALAVTQPFSAAKESILTLLDPTAPKEQDSQGNQSIDTVFIFLHSICFTFVNQDAFAEKKVEFLELLRKRIGAMKLNFKMKGVYLGICSITSLFQYNLKESRMKLSTIATENQKATAEADNSYRAAQAQKDDHDNTLPPGPVIDGYEPKNALLVEIPELDPQVNFDISLAHAQELAFDILSLVFKWETDSAVQPCLHVWLIFLDYLKEYPKGMALIVKNFPWEQLARYATCLLKKRQQDDAAMARIHDITVFPVVKKGFRPLPEEYLMRGLEITRRYFPYGYFDRVQVDDDERILELPSMNLVREEKILWLLTKFADYGPWINYDPSRAVFSVSPELKMLLQEHNKQPELIRNSTFILDDDSDIEMTIDHEEGDENFDEIENPELVQLLAQKRALRKKLDDPDTPSKEGREAKTSAAFSSESFKPGFTTVVVDTNCLVKNLDVFKELLDSNQWSIVLSYSVITELRGLQRNDGRVSETSELALNLLARALQEKRNLKIVTAKGSNISSLSGQYYELIEDYSGDGRKNLDDIIIGTAKAQGELSAKPPPGSEIQPVVLVTDDVIMRVKAGARGVASVDTKQWLKYMSPLDSTPFDEETQRKIADTYHSLMTKYPKMDQDRVYKAARDTAGDEDTAAGILKRDISAKKKRARAHMERHKQHEIAG